MLVRPVPIGAQRVDGDRVAPTSRHRATRPRSRSGWSGVATRWPSRSSASGSRPALEAASRTTERAAVNSGPIGTGGIGSHPSARRPTRANARGSVPHPIQIGTGSGGSGAMPGGDRPPPTRRSWSTLGSVNRRRSSGICSSMRAPRVAEVDPERLVLHVVPPDARRRAGCVRARGAASVATCFATSAVCRCGSISTSVTSSSVHDAGEVREQHERLEERVVRVVETGPAGRALRVGADHVVVDEEVVVPGVLEALHEGDDLVRVHPGELRLGEHRSEPHPHQSARAPDRARAQSS